MKIEVKNLGPIKEGTISLEKDLILLTGPNNTGKSYLAYLVYGIMAIDNKVKGYYDWRYLAVTLKQQFSEENKIKKLKISHEEIVNILTEEIKKNNLRIFSSERLNPDFRLHLSNNFLVEKKNEIDHSFDFISDNVIITEQNFLLYSLSLRFIKFLQLPPTFFYPAERTAINMLAKEIYREKSIERDELAFLVAQEDWIAVKELTQKKLVPRYPLAINDYLSFVYDLEHTSKNESEFTDLAQEIETLLLKGKVSLSQYGDIRFTPMGTDEALEIHISSSLVKSLSGLVLYLRHLAKKGDLIIIDEPELNLHPDNQRLMARVLARMINKGFKLMVSTHSDYIIRQLNNLIMLGNKENEKAEELRKYYKYKTAETLDFNRVTSYFFNGNSMQEIPADEKGIDVPTIEDEVHELNNESHEIYYSLSA